MRRDGAGQYNPHYGDLPTGVLPSLQDRNTRHRRSVRPMRRSVRTAVAPPPGGGNCHRADDEPPGDCPVPRAPSGWWDRCAVELSWPSASACAVARRSACRRRWTEHWRHRHSLGRPGRARHRGHDRALSAVASQRSSATRRKPIDGAARGRLGWRHPNVDFTFDSAALGGRGP